MSLARYFFFFFFPRTIFNIKIDIDLFQGRPHAWALEIRKHDELDIGRGLEIMQLVLIGAVRDSMRRYSK